MDKNKTKILIIKVIVYTLALASMGLLTWYTITLNDNNPNNDLPLGLVSGISLILIGIISFIMAYAYSLQGKYAGANKLDSIMPYIGILMVLLGILTIVIFR